MRDFNLRPKLWDDIEIFLKHEQKKEDLVVDPSKIGALEKVTQLGCLLMKMLSTIERTKVDRSSLGATLELQLEELIELVRPALLRHFTNEEFGVQVRRMKDMLEDFVSDTKDTEAEEMVESIQQMSLLLVDIESKGRPATPAEVAQIKEIFAQIESQKEIFPNMFDETEDDSDEFRETVTRILGAEISEDIFQMADRR